MNNPQRQAGGTTTTSLYSSEGAEYNKEGKNSFSTEHHAPSGLIIIVGASPPAGTGGY
jgi:hypothetical protein